MTGDTEQSERIIIMLIDLPKIPSTTFRVSFGEEAIMVRARGETDDMLSQMTASGDYFRRANYCGDETA